jgi:tRNA dimethylallyltransferase
VDKIIPEIFKRGKLPIICGGTGFWIKAIVDNVKFPAVKPDRKLRKKLERKTLHQLINLLKRLDPRRLKSIDKNNKVRLIRAIEIAGALGKVPTYNLQLATCNFLQIGIKLSKEKLRKNIKKRLEARFRQGMIEEVKKLHNPPAGGGLSWKKIQSFGLGYYWIPLYIQGKINKEDLFEKIYQSEKNYAKRQMTWFRKDCRIMWLKNGKEIISRANKFLKD